MENRITTPFKDIKIGDRLVADDGFTCIFPGQVCTVKADEKGEMFVPCFGPECAAEMQSERHYLDGQEDDDGNLVGFRREHKTSTI